MELKRGKYIVLEGGEASGKSDNSEIAKEALENLGFSVEIVHEPGGDKFGEAIRKNLKDAKLDRPADVNTLIFNALRVLTLIQVKQYLNDGKWVISDRSWVSTYAYQVCGEGGLCSLAEDLTIYTSSILKSDLTIILDVSFEVAKERLNNRLDIDVAGDRWDSQDEAFFGRVSDGYLEIAKRFSFPTVDADKTLEEVSQQVWECIERRLLES